MGRRNRRPCVECGRPIVGWLPNMKRSPRSVRAVRAAPAGHDLCRRCWSAENDRQRARKLRGNHDRT